MPSIVFLENAKTQRKACSVELAHEFGLWNDHEPHIKASSMEQAASTSQASFPRSVGGREKYAPAGFERSALSEGQDNSTSAIWLC